MNINKKLKILVATSALFAMNIGHSAWATDVLTGSDMTLKQTNALIDHATATTAAGAIAVGLDITDLSGKTLNTVAAPFAVTYGTVGATASAGEVTLTLKGTLAKDATFDGNKLGGVKIKSIAMNTSGDGYTIFKLSDFAAHVGAGNALLNTIGSGTSIIDAQAGSQKVGFELVLTSNQIKKGWINYGTDAAKMTDLRLHATDANGGSFEGADYDFTHVNDINISSTVAGTFALNNKAGTAPTSLTFSGTTLDNTVSTFAADTVLKYVKYVPGDKSVTKGGAAGKIQANENIQVNNLGEASYAVAEVSVDANKKLTIGDAGTTAAPVKPTWQFVNKVLFNGNAATVVFNGNKLCAVGAAAPFKSTQSEIDFGGHQNGVFEVAGETVELMATASNVNSTATQESKIKISKGEKTITGDNAFVFGGITEIATGGSVVIANKATATSSLGTVTFAAKESEISVSVTASDDKHPAMLLATTFKFTDEKQTANFKVTEDSKIALNTLIQHPVKFIAAKEGQSFVLKSGSYTRIDPDWALTGSKTLAHSIVVEKDATLVGYFNDFDVNGANAAFGITAAKTTDAAVAAFIADKTIMKDLGHVLVVKDGGALKFNSRDTAGTNTDFAPAVFGKVTFEGKATISDTGNTANISANSFAADNACLQLDGSIALGSKDGALKVKSVAGIDGKDQANTLGVVGASFTADWVKTSFASTYDVTVGYFAADNDGQKLSFGGKGTDSGTTDADKAQVVKATIKKGDKAYAEVLIGAFAAIKYTGDIWGVKRLVIAADKDKTATIDSSVIEADDLVFGSVGATNRGKVQFVSANVDLKSDVKKGAHPVDLEFKGVTLSKKFDNNAAKVKADSVTVNTADVTMESLSAKSMLFKQTSKITTGSAVSDLVNLTLEGAANATYDKAVSLSGNLVLDLGTDGDRLVSSSKITLNGLEINGVKDFRSFSNDATIVLAKGGAAAAYSGPALIKKTYYDLAISTEGNNIVAKIINRKDLGDVVTKESAASVTAQDLKVVSANMKAITVAASKSGTNNEFSKFQDFLIGTDATKARFTLPETIQAAREVVSMVDMLATNRIDSFSTPGMTSGSPADAEGMAMWVEGVYGSGEQKAEVNSKEVTSYKDTKWGVSFGADYKISDNSIFGLSLGYGCGDVTHEESKDVEKISAVLVSGYAVQNYGDAFFNERIGAAKLDGERSFKRGVDMKSTSSPVQYFASFASGYNIKVTELANVAPIFKLRFENVLAYDEAETGGAQNFNINNPAKTSLVGSLGGRVAFNLVAGEEMSISPDIHGFLNYDLLASEEVGTFKVSSANVATEMQYNNIPAFSADAGVGLTIKSSNGFEAGVKLDGQFRDKYVGLLGALKVKVQF